MNEFIGFEEIIENFKIRANNDNLSHAHIICGADGIGKSILAKILAKVILNGKLDREYVDIISYKSEKASFGVDDIRAITEEIHKRPYECDKKVILIQEGNKLTTQAQNALLKTIEEPPKGRYIIIICESIELILETIRSRCEIHKLSPLTTEDLLKYIDNNYKDKTNQEKKWAIAYSEGIPGKINNFFEDKDLAELRDNTIKLLNSISNNEHETILELEEVFVKFSKNKEEVLKTLANFIRDILIYKEISDATLVINGDKEEEIKTLANNLSFNKLNSMLNSISEARKSINHNVGFSTVLRVLFIDFSSKK